MIIYLILIILCPFLVFLGENAKQRKLFLPLTIISLLLLSVIGGCRDVTIGTDTQGYPLEYFTNSFRHKTWNSFISNNSSNIFYLLIVWLSHWISKSFNLFLFLCCLTTYSFVYIAAYKMKKLYNHKMMWLSILIFILLFYNQSFNMARQILAQGTCLLAFAYLLEGKHKTSYIWWIISAGFHSTFIAFGLVYIIRRILYYKPSIKVIILILGTAIILVFSTTFAIKLFIEQGLLLDRFAEYTNENSYGASLPLSDFYIIISNLFILWVSRNKITKHELYFYVTLLLFCLVFCFSGLINTYIVRFMYYILFIFQLIIPKIILENKKNKKTLIRLTIFLYSIYWIVAIAILNLGDTSPYKSIFK